jgi:glycine oxidase
VVVGGGVIGMAAGWRLSRAGHEVTVIDPDAGHGATWAAAGMLAPTSEASFGEDSLLALNLAALERWRTFEHELGSDAHDAIGLRRDGTLNVALDHDDRVALDRLTAFRVSLDLPVVPLTGSQARRLEPFLSPSVRGGLLAEGDLSVDNRRYWLALRDAAVAHGARMTVGRVTRVRIEAGRVRGVSVDDGTAVACDTVVVAAGSGSGLLPGLEERHRLPVRPVKGQILRLSTAPVDPAGQGLLARTVRALVRGREVYVVPRETGEVVVGATVEERGHDVTVTAGAVRELLRDACEVLPVLDELELREARAGLRPGTPDNGPIVGATDVAGLIFATGHYRHGILLSPITADAVVDIVAGRDLAPHWLPFAPDRFLGGHV